MMDTDYLEDSLRDCLSQQLSEIEFLKAMYPLDNEIEINSKAVTSIQQFLETKNEYVPQYLDLTVNIIRENLKLEIVINLPTLYPKELPDINVRCNQLNRQQETTLNLLLLKHLTENHAGVSCIYNAITWLQDYIDENVNEFTQIASPSTASKEIQQFKIIRMWIVSHHIYCKKKREEIVKKAKDGKLTGFCSYGKPGVICYEGFEDICYDSWKEIKAMSWKKIGVKKVEYLKSASDKQFNKFEELMFDTSDFFKFMEKNGFTHIFNELFGF